MASIRVVKVESASLETVVVTYEVQGTMVGDKGVTQLRIVARGKPGLSLDEGKRVADRELRALVKALHEQLESEVARARGRRDATPDE